MSGRTSGRRTKRSQNNQNNQQFEAPKMKLKYKTPSIHLNLEARNERQVELIEAFNDSHILFAEGVAGTGKTYILVTLALQALLYNEVEKIIVTRPIVEAGEKLGFLPGDIRDKTDPYNAPVLEILEKHLTKGILEDFIETGKIQIIPLAFTRGRTYENAMMILDEAQNTTVGQMHMFLTRMGEGSKVLVTGDKTQIDLPRHVESGFGHAIGILNGVEGVAVVGFEECHVQRHVMVGRVAEAYAKANYKATSLGGVGIIAKPKEEVVEVVPEVVVPEPVMDPRLPKEKKKASKSKKKSD